jgi:hypothetical protein
LIGVVAVDSFWAASPVKIGVGTMYSLRVGTAERLRQRQLSATTPKSSAITTSTTSTKIEVAHAQQQPLPLRAAGKASAPRISFIISMPATTPATPSALSSILYSSDIALLHQSPTGTAHNALSSLPQARRRRKWEHERASANLAGMHQHEQQTLPSRDSHRAYDSSSSRLYCICSDQL